MQFVNNGPNIPEKLHQAHEDVLDEFYTFREKVRPRLTERLRVLSLSFMAACRPI